MTIFNIANELITKRIKTLRFKVININKYLNIQLINFSNFGFFFYVFNINLTELDNYEQYF
ncbi:MAG: hypothetical protein A2033_01730 [Bacteroidetes bacterium GWA2_31_9]|nr:MAG: hypothetical protein A2033_01730 [Bacteroidetes bacterium GWA2_31_9]